jgi:hypothetical protein
MTSPIDTGSLVPLQSESELSAQRDPQTMTVTLLERGKSRMMY